MYKNSMNSPDCNARFTLRPTPHQLHVAFGHLRCTGEIFHLFTPKTDKIRL